MEQEPEPSVGSPSHRPRFEGILQAAREYETARKRLFADLHVVSRRNHSPNGIVSQVVVAEAIGGLALPDQYGRSPQVLGPGGEEIMVFTVGGEQDRVTHMFHPVFDPTDIVAIVGFVDGVPRAVHLIPVDRVSAVADAFDLWWGKGRGRCVAIDTRIHCDLVMEPLAAAVMGVRTILLEPPPSEAGETVLAGGRREEKPGGDSPPGL